MQQEIPSKHRLIDFIPIFLRTFTTDTTLCHHNSPSLYQLQYQTDLICKHRRVHW